LTFGCFWLLLLRKTTTTKKNTQKVVADQHTNLEPRRQIAQALVDAGKLTHRVCRVLDRVVVCLGCRLECLPLRLQCLLTGHNAGRAKMAARHHALGLLGHGRKRCI
jgi:hypothetical protein